VWSLVRCFGLESTPVVDDVHGRSIDGWAVQGDDRWMREMDGEAIGGPCFRKYLVVRPDWVDNGPQRARPFP